MAINLMVSTEASWWNILNLKNIFKKVQNAVMKWDYNLNRLINSLGSEINDMRRLKRFKPLHLLFYFKNAQCKAVSLTRNSDQFLITTNINCLECHLSCHILAEMLSQQVSVVLKLLHSWTDCNNKKLGHNMRWKFPHPLFRNVTPTT